MATMSPDPDRITATARTLADQLRASLPPGYNLDLLILGGPTPPWKLPRTAPPQLSWPPAQNS